MDKIELFNPDNEEFTMPSITQSLDKGMLSEKDIKEGLKSGTELISEGLERAILGDTVKKMMIAEDVIVSLPNYVIDFTNIDEMYDFQMEAIDSLLHPDGDVVLYAYTRAGLAKLGAGLSTILDRILPLAIANLFNNKCKIYKDFIIGEKPRVVSDKNIATMRLSI